MAKVFDTLKGYALLGGVEGTVATLSELIHFDVDQSKAGGRVYLRSSPGGEVQEIWLLMRSRG